VQESGQPERGFFRRLLHRLRRAEFLVALIVELMAAGILLLIGWLFKPHVLRATWGFLQSNFSSVGLSLIILSLLLWAHRRGRTIRRLQRANAALNRTAERAQAYLSVMANLAKESGDPDPDQHRQLIDGALDSVQQSLDGADAVVLLAERQGDKTVLVARHEARNTYPRFKDARVLVEPPGDVTVSANSDAWKGDCYMVTSVQSDNRDLDANLLARLRESHLGGERWVCTLSAKKLGLASKKLGQIVVASPRRFDPLDVLFLDCFSQTLAGHVFDVTQVHPLLKAGCVQAEDEGLFSPDTGGQGPAQPDADGAPE